VGTPEQPARPLRSLAKTDFLRLQKLHRIQSILYHTAVELSLGHHSSLIKRVYVREAIEQPEE
jgi:hypothetical protein